MCTYTYLLLAYLYIVLYSGWYCIKDIPVLAWNCMGGSELWGEKFYVFFNRFHYVFFILGKNIGVTGILIWPVILHGMFLHYWFFTLWSFSGSRLGQSYLDGTTRSELLKSFETLSTEDTDSMATSSKSKNICQFYSIHQLLVTETVS